MRLLAELTPLFGNIQHRVKVSGIECDILIPDLNVAILVDGFYFHKARHEKDVATTLSLRDAGLTVVRLRGKGLLPIESSFDYDETLGLRMDDIKGVLRHLMSRLPLKGYRRKIMRYLAEHAFTREHDYLSLVSQIPGPGKGKSLSDLYPDVAANWHPTLNGRLLPTRVSAHSNLKVFWLCPKGHTFQGIIGDRSRGIGCPFCSGIRVTIENSLETKLPRLAAEWHPTKNGELTAADFTYASSKVVWWKCSTNGAHAWKAPISNRSTLGSGCPFCTGKKVDSRNSLAARNPILAKQWNSKLNGKLTPKNVTVASSRKAWWICSKVSAHIWQATVNNRHTRKSGCPYCSGALTDSRRSLATLRPAIALQWHPTKNLGLSANEVSLGSSRVAWWICDRCGHEWKSPVRQRVTSKFDCPSCSK